MIFDKELSGHFILSTRKTMRSKKSEKNDSLNDQPVGKEHMTE